MNDPSTRSAPSGPDPITRMMRDLMLPEAAPTGTLERYELRELLGEGGSASVHRAIDREIGREVAIKVLRDTYDPNLRARFLREGRLMASLGHPNLVKVYDVGDDHGRLFLVMELVKGRPLRRTDLARDIEALAKAARAIHKAHEAGVIHRDLKPSNILVTGEGEPKVVDFGLARHTNSTSMTRTGAVMGTLCYMAPEQARGEGEVTVRTDVYALGALLYEILGGRPPHVGGTDAELLNRVLNDEPPTLDDTAPEDLETICLHAMEKSPANRYATAAEFADDLERWQRGEPVAATRASAARKAGAFLVKRAAIAIAAAAVLIIGALVVTFVLPRWTAEQRARAQQDELRRRQELARQHLGEGRALLQQLDRLMMTADWTNDMRRALAEKARAEFNAALEALPEDPEALLELARTCRFEDDGEGAWRFLARAVKAAPTLVTARLERLLLGVERYEEFRHKSNGDVSPATPEALAVRDGILEDIGVIRSWSSEKKELRFAEGMLQFAHGDYEPAAKVMEEYAEAAVTDARAWQWAGHAWFHARRHQDDAIEALSKGLKLRPRDAWSLRMRGVLREECGESKEALADLNAALAVEPDRAQTLADRGHVRIHLEDVDGGIEDLTKALSVAATGWTGRAAAEQYLSRAYFKRGLEGQNAGKLDEAIQDYTEAVRFNNRFAEAYANRGLILHRRREFDRAIADFERALEVAPKQWSFRSMIERTLQQALAAREK